MPPLVPMQTARTKERRKVRAAPQVNSAEIATVEANGELCFAGAPEPTPDGNCQGGGHCGD